MRKRSLISAAPMTVLGLVLAVAALGLAGTHAQAAPEDEIEATVQAAVAAWNDGDAETFIGYFTQAGLTSFVDYEPTVEAVQSDMDDTGPITSAEVAEVKDGGVTFTAIVDWQFEAGFSIYQRWTFSKTTGGWVVSATESAARPIPPGVPAVDMTLQEYAFNYNKAAINAADGNFAFSVTNVGKEQHEILILRVDSDKPLQQLLEESDPESEEPPEGVEFVQFGGFFEPGDVGTVLFEEPLTSGNYALICFVESPDGTPHALLGMISEFSVGGGPVVTPPDTGDGGVLHNSSAGTLNWVFFSVAATVLVGGGALLARSHT